MHTDTHILSFHCRYSETVALLLEEEAELADYVDNIDQFNIKKNNNFVFFQVRRSLSNEADVTP